MATWVMHFRIAEYFRTRLEVEEVPFIVGNIGPDCGEPNEDWSQFTPPSNVTHWSDGESKRDIDSEAFYIRYLSDTKKLSKNQYSFYLGYYLHLLTDIAFSQETWKPLNEKYKEAFTKDKNFIWKVKKDWYDLDHLYLKEHPDFFPFKVFEKIEAFPNEYLDYYSDTAIIKQIQYITKFYQKQREDLDRVYTYLTKEEVDDFIKRTCKKIEEKLNEKIRGI